LPSASLRHEQQDAFPSTYSLWEPHCSIPPRQTFPRIPGGCGPQDRPFSHPRRRLSYTRADEAVEPATPPADNRGPAHCGVRVRRQKPANRASRSGKAAGPDGAGTLTSSAVPFCGTRLNRARRSCATSHSPVLEPPAMIGMLRNPRLSCCGIASSSPSPSSGESCKPLVPRRIVHGAPSNQRPEPAVTAPQ